MEIPVFRMAAILQLPITPLSRSRLWIGLHPVLQNLRPMTHPPIVPRAEWQLARDRLMAKERELTQAHDTLAAACLRPPMWRVDPSLSILAPP